jgi:hypothetical protein
MIGLKIHKINYLLNKQWKSKHNQKNKKTLIKKISIQTQIIKRNMFNLQINYKMY